MAALSVGGGGLAESVVRSIEQYRYTKDALVIQFNYVELKVTYKLFGRKLTETLNKKA